MSDSPGGCLAAVRRSARVGEPGRQPGRQAAVPPRQTNRGRRSALPGPPAVDLQLPQRPRLVGVLRRHAPHRPRRQARRPAVARARRRRSPPAGRTSASTTRPTSSPAPRWGRCSARARCGSCAGCATSLPADVRARRPRPQHERCGRADVAPGERPVPVERVRQHHDPRPPAGHGPPAAPPRPGRRTRSPGCASGCSRRRPTSAPRCWVDDPAFDLRYHVRHIALPKPGTMRQLLDLASLIAVDPFDRTRPLWQFWIVDGIRGGKSALVQKMHHTITDGEGGIQLSLAVPRLRARCARAAADRRRRGRSRRPRRRTSIAEVDAQHDRPAACSCRSAWCRQIRDLLADPTGQPQADVGHRRDGAQRAQPARRDRQGPLAAVDGTLARSSRGGAAGAVRGQPATRPGASAARSTPRSSPPPRRPPAPTTTASARRSRRCGRAWPSAPAPSRPARTRSPSGGCSCRPARCRSPSASP